MTAHHAFRCPNVSWALVGVVGRCKRGQDCQTIENLRRDENANLPECNMNPLQHNTCKCLRTNLLVMFSEPQQQLIVETLEVLPQQRAQFDLRLTLGDKVQYSNNKK